MELTSLFSSPAVSYSHGHLFPRDLRRPQFRARSEPALAIRSIHEHLYCEAFKFQKSRAFPSLPSPFSLFSPLSLSSLLLSTSLDRVGSAVATTHTYLPCRVQTAQSKWQASSRSREKRRGGLYLFASRYSPALGNKEPLKQCYFLCIWLKFDVDWYKT